MFGPHVLRAIIEVLLVMGLLLAVYLLLNPGPVILLGLALIGSAVVILRNRS